MSEETPIKCKECGSSKWSKIYPDEQLEGKSEALQFALARQVQCNECSYCWEMSRVQIIRHFVWLQTSQGKTSEQILEEVTEVKKTAEEEMKERFRK